MTVKMKEIEREKGKPIKDILKELYRHFGTQQKVADELGIDQSTLSIWLIRLGLETKTILVEREKITQ